MRHKAQKGKLGKTASHREAMLRNMTTSLLENGRIITTLPKAKVLRRRVEKMITLAKQETLHARRQAYGYIRSKDVVAKLFNKINLHFADRNGGYTRIIPIGARKGDNAQMAVIELIGLAETKEEKIEKKKFSDRFRRSKKKPAKEKTRPTKEVVKTHLEKADEEIEEIEEEEGSEFEREEDKIIDQKASEDSY